MNTESRSAGDMKLRNLSEKASVYFNKATSINSMLRNALKRGEAADYNFLNHFYEDAYVNYLMALNIIYTHAKAHPEFQSLLEKRDDLVIGALRAAPKMLDNAEICKVKIIEKENHNSQNLKSDPIYPDNNNSPNGKSLPRIPGLKPSPFIQKAITKPNQFYSVGSDNSIKPNENVITPMTLIPILNQYNLTQSPSILFLDVRPSHLFQDERMNVTQLVNIEPLVLKRNTNSVQIEQNLKLTNEKFYNFFSKRNLYDYVVILDQDSDKLLSPVPLGSSTKSFQALFILYQALTVFEFEKKLKHVPILLAGGLDAWKSKTFESGIIKGPDNFNSKVLGENLISRRHAISQARSKNIVRSLNDYIQNAQLSDQNDKQSMQFPPKNNQAHTHSIDSQTMSNYNSTRVESTRSRGLQRRKTIFDNPYYGFTPTKKELNQYKKEINEEIYVQPKPDQEIKKDIKNIPSLVPVKVNPPPIPKKPDNLRNITPVNPPLVTSLSYAMNIGTTGLKNLGNTCYMNSILQCLNGTIPLARYFLDGSFKKCVNKVNPLGYKGELAAGFHELVRTLWTENASYHSPLKFKGLIDTVSQQFKGYDQQDSQEFLAFLLDGLHEDLNLVLKKPTFPDDDILDKLPEKEASELAWDRHLQRDSSIIVSLFQGQLKSKLQCKVCSKTSTTFNVFMYLSLPIPMLKGISLMDCLKHFVKEELLDGDDAWNCPNCKCPRPATKTLSISRLPDILLIHLKRFSYEGPFRNKLDSLVNFPLRGLDLDGFVPKTAPRSNILSPKGTPLGNSYDLYAVSNHYGSLTGGHYTAYVRSGYGGKWHCYDDSRVTIMDEKGVVTKAGYNLFYVRTNRETAHL